MGAVIVLVDHRGSRLKPSAAALLAVAHQVGREQTWPVHAVWVGTGHDADAAGALARQGATVQHVIEVDGADPGLTGSVSAALESVTDAVLASAQDRLEGGLVLLPSSFEGKEVAARLAVATGAGVVVGATSVVVEDGRVVAGKAVLAGSWRSRCEVTSALAIVALDARGVGTADGPPGTAHEVVVQRHTVQVPAATAVQVVSRAARPAGERPALADAEVVVVGGRGTEGDFSPVADLADALGGAVGATRVATDEGWAPHELQVGQTGVTISPRLYIGAGVSGAVHHRGGMDSSTTVVAVNTDPDAPIFEFADLAVVGDLATVLPALAAEIRARRGGGS